MSRKDYSKTIDKNDPAIKEAQKRLKLFKPVGTWLSLLGLKDWKIEKLLHKNEIEKNGLFDMCRIYNGQLVCTFEQAERWHVKQEKKRA